VKESIAHGTGDRSWARPGQRQKEEFTAGAIGIRGQPSLDVSTSRLKVRPDSMPAALRQSGFPLLFLNVLFICLGSVLSAVHGADGNAVRNFFTEHCLDCHDDSIQKGDLA
jgi:hypothetical protein